MRELSSAIFAVAGEIVPRINEGKRKIKTTVKKTRVGQCTPVNAACPYSGDPVSPEALADIDGTVVGYCNTFCRDKSVADAEAWPQTMALRSRA